MRAVGSTAELRMELYTQVEGMPFQLHDLDQLSIPRGPTGDQASGIEGGPELVVDLKPMAMAFGDVWFPVGPRARVPGSR